MNCELEDRKRHLRSDASCQVKLDHSSVGELLMLQRPVASRALAFNVAIPDNVHVRYCSWNICMQIMWQTTA
eukprot:4399710-Amphidinium_carterae.1